MRGPPRWRTAAWWSTSTTPTWATQLRFLEADLLRRLRDVAGVDEVSRIELRVRPR